MLADSARHWPVAPRTDQVAAALDVLAERPLRLLLIEGDPGVGKTALAAAVARKIDEARPLIATGTSERTATPLGALDRVCDHLGIDADSLSSATLVATLGRRLAGKVLIVDDAPRLDAASAEVVRRLVRGVGIRVVATGRSTEALPAPLRSLDDEGLIGRYHLEGLGAGAVERLLADVFRVPARDADVNQLVWETAGNPLHLRMIVETAIDAGEVLHRGDHVQLTRTVDPIGVAALLSSRVAALNPEAYQTLWVIALTQPAPLGSLRGRRDRSAEIAELLKLGMIALEPGDERVTIAHPLVSEALDPAARHDTTLDEAVRLLRASGDPTRRFAAVQLEHEHGRRTSVDDLVWAAAYASTRGEHVLAATLADAAMRLPSRRTTAFAAHLAAANQHSLAQNLDEADRLFSLTATLAREPGERASLASSVGEHLAFRRGDPARALAQAEEVRESLTAQESLALDADLWRWRVLAQQRQEHDGIVEEGIRASIAATIAASMRGEPAAAGRAAAPLVAAEGGPLAPMAAIALGVQRCVELRAEGNAADARDYLEAARAEAADAVGFFTVMLAAQRTQEGHLSEAQRLADLAVDQLRRWDGGELLALALAVQATVNAQRGALDLARRQLTELEGFTVSGAAVLQRAEARAFLLAAEGDPAGAARVILAVVEDAVASGYRFFGALTLANALRFGELEGTVVLAERLCEGLAEHVEPCIALRDVAVALTQRKPEQAEAPAERLARAGLVTAAIDAISLALALPAGDATRRRLHALGLALSEGVDAPPLQARDVPALTPRERAVAELAANRHRTREIAATLGVSARTVENQLHSAYRKLGVASRDDLRAALGGLGALSDGGPTLSPSGRLRS